MSSNDSPSSITGTVLNSIPEDCRGAFQAVESMKRLIRRTRSDVGDESMTVDSREELPDLYGKFLLPDGEDFVKWDSGAQPDRIVIFSTSRNLQSLQFSEHWFMDGTFKCQPIYFDQLFVISAQRGEGVTSSCFPVVFCLTPNRTTATYERIFKKLLELQPGLTPKYIMSDFEQAMRKAASLVFPNSEMKGCFFHFRQANQRYIQGSCPFSL